MDAVAGVAFAKNFLSGGELPFLRDAAQPATRRDSNPEKAPLDSNSTITGIYAKV
jgi:hypothetical protein